MDQSSGIGALGEILGLEGLVSKLAPSALEALETRGEVTTEMFRFDRNAGPQQWREATEQFLAVCSYALGRCSVVFVDGTNVVEFIEHVDRKCTPSRALRRIRDRHLTMTIDVMGSEAARKLDEGILVISDLCLSAVMALPGMDEGRNDQKFLVSLFRLVVLLGHAGFSPFMPEKKDLLDKAFELGLKCLQPANT